LNARFLIVEEEIAVIHAIGDILRANFGSDAEFQVCRTAEHALQRLEQESFDLLLTDWQLPGISGLALIMLARKKYPGLKTVFLADSQGEKFKERVSGLFNLYVSRPFEIPALERLLHELVPGGRCPI
jgi:CheY-like chemotaxis protein